MNLFMHNKFFTFFFFFLKTALNATQAKYNIVGLKFRLAGKISGVGNARKRTMTLKHGKINLNNMQLQTSHAFYLVRTTSGCLGLSMFLFFKR